jgi:hypothetical protein
MPGCPSSGISIGAALTATVECSDPATGVVCPSHTYTAVANAAMANGTVSLSLPIVEDVDSRSIAKALLYGRWIERRARRYVLAPTVGSAAGSLRR